MSAHHFTYGITISFQENSVICLWDWFAKEEDTLWKNVIKANYRGEGLMIWDGESRRVHMAMGLAAGNLS